VVTANSSVHFFQNVSCFLLFYAPQVRLGKASFVELVIEYCEPDSSLLDILGFFEVRW